MAAIPANRTEKRTFPLTRYPYDKLVTVEL